MKNIILLSLFSCIHLYSSQPPLSPLENVDPRAKEVQEKTALTVKEIEKNSNLSKQHLLHVPYHPKKPKESNFDQKSDVTSPFPKQHCPLSGLTSPDLNEKAIEIHKKVKSMLEQIKNNKKKTAQNSLMSLSFIALPPIAIQPKQKTRFQRTHISFKEDSSIDNTSAHIHKTTFSKEEPRGELSIDSFSPISKPSSNVPPLPAFFLPVLPIQQSKQQESEASTLLIEKSAIDNLSGPLRFNEQKHTRTKPSSKKDDKDSSMSTLLSQKTTSLPHIQPTLE